MGVFSFLDIINKRDHLIEVLSMSKKDIEDYLQEGMYGAREINPDEKRKYLGTYRERVILALTKPQVRGEKGLKELENNMIKFPDARLLMNGNMSFHFFKPYRELASKNNIYYTSVTNREAESDYGIILTEKTAIDLENILLPEEEKPITREKQKKSWWKQIFGS